jgi:hypothetical protein
MSMIRLLLLAAVLAGCQNPATPTVQPARAVADMTGWWDFSTPQDHVAIGFLPDGMWSWNETYDHFHYFGPWTEEPDGRFRLDGTDLRFEFLLELNGTRIVMTYNEVLWDNQVRQRPSFPIPPTP